MSELLAIRVSGVFFISSLSYIKRVADASVLALSSSGCSTILRDCFVDATCSAFVLSNFSFYSATHFVILRLCYLKAKLIEDESI